MIREASELSVRDAAYHTIRAYPGGAVALAARMGMKCAATLSHKVAPNSTQYHLNLEEVMSIQAFTDDDRILFAMARERGYVCIKVSQSDVEDVNQNIAETVKEFGEYLGSVSEAVKDQRITDNEISDIAAHMGALAARTNQLHATLLALNRKAKPKSTAFKTVANFPKSVG